MSKIKMMNVEDFWRITKKELPDFHRGNVLRLDFASGVDSAQDGMKAIVVSPEDYQDYYSELCDKVTQDVVDKEFVAVIWVDGTVKDGFYHKARFSLSQGATA